MKQQKKPRKENESSQEAAKEPATSASEGTETPAPPGQDETGAKAERESAPSKPDGKSKNQGQSMPSRDSGNAELPTKDEVNATTSPAIPKSKGGKSKKDVDKKESASQSSSESQVVQPAPKAKTAEAKAKNTKAKPQSTFVDGPTPLVTAVLVITNLVVFGLMYKQDPTCLWKPTGDFLMSAGADYGPLFAGGQWWRILTSGFVHCGAWHLLLNMCALYNIGGSIERRSESSNT